MSAATVAARLTADPELHERLTRELARCPEPEKVLTMIDDLKSLSTGPFDGEELIRVVIVAVDRVALRRPAEPRPRMKALVFNPEAVLRDPAAQSMSELEWGAYSRLFCELWRQPEPGIAPDNDNALAGLAHLDLNAWTVVRPAVERAFDTRALPGFWVLQWMRAALASQDQYLDSKRAAGKKGAQVRMAKAAKRRLWLVDTQSSSAAQAIVNPGIRGSGNQRICSVTGGEGDSRELNHPRRSLIGQSEGESEEPCEPEPSEDDIPPPPEVVANDGDPNRGR